MTHLKGVDHTAILVRDLAGAEEAYRRLGFKTTPIGRHNKTGTANHCVMFADDFFELFGILTPTGFNKPWAAAVAEREGLWAACFTSADINATYAGFKDAGFNPTEPKDFSRPVELPGSAQQARFTLTYLEPEAVEGIRLFACIHHTPELVWRPEYLGHQNAATAISHLTIAIDDPIAAASAYGRVTGTTPVARPGGMDVPGPRATIRLITLAQAAMDYAGDPILDCKPPVPIGFGFKVSDRRATKAALDANGVPFRTLENGGIRVASAYACGVALDFA